MAVKSKEKRQLSPAEITAFCSQLALIVKAGISVQEGIGIMAEDAADPRGKEILEGIFSHVEEGRQLYFALKETGCFPKYMVDMVEIGEASGRLDEVLDSLSAYYEHNESIMKSIKQAVTYPAVMILMMAVVIVVLVVNVMPIFNQVFLQLGSEMSVFSQGIMNFGSLLSGCALWVVAVILLLILTFILMRNTQGGRKILSRWYDSCIFTRKLSAKIAAGRFASAMSLMLASGLDLDQSIDMTSQLIENEKIRAKISALKKQMAAGSTFAESVVKAELFSSVYARMVVVGFKTGSVDAVMNKIAKRYEEEVEDRISHILSILEPTLVAILAVIVGMILLSVMLPLMGIMTSIG